MLLNTDEQEITVLGNLGKEEPQELYKIQLGASVPGIAASSLTDMKLMHNNRLLTLSTDGKVSVFKVGKVDYTLLKEFDLRSIRQLSQGVQFVSLGVDDSGASDFFCVSTLRLHDKVECLDSIAILELDSQNNVKFVG